MYWISGVAVAFGDLSGLKTRIITTKQSTPELIIEITQKYNVTDVFCNATQLTGALVILRQSKIVLPSLKVFAAGGAAVSFNAVTRDERLCTQWNSHIWIWFNRSGGNRFD